MGCYRALAIDYDGTLTHGRRPEQPMLEALRAARSNGVEVVLVTGRILETA
jgi:hydroxymethylpyrimidine pyrophosphatase-like HAD family hydrolase